MSPVPSLPPSPARRSTARPESAAAGAAILVRAALAASAAFAAGGCGTASSGEWSTKHQSMSVERTTELVRVRDDARLPVPDAASPRDEASPDPMVAAKPPREAAGELLETAAGSSFAALRANAIEGLGKDPQRLRPIIGRALVDSNRAVRFVAANVLSKAGLCDQSNLLEPLVRDESDSVRAGAIAALAECGVRVDQSALADMLRSDDPEVRGNAYLAVGMIGNRSAAPMVRDSLGRGMRLVNPLRVKLVELQGGEALVRLGDAAEIEPIRAALFAPGEQGELTVLACQILGRLGDQQSQGALFRLSRPTGDDVRPVEIRLAALRALADLGAPDRAQLLESSLPYLKDASAMIRAQACFTVGAIGGDSAVQSLVPLMADLDPNVQVAAAGAILAADSRR